MYIQNKIEYKKVNRYKHYFSTYYIIKQHYHTKLILIYQEKCNS